MTQVSMSNSGGPTTPLTLFVPQAVAAEMGAGSRFRCKMVGQREFKVVRDASARTGFSRYRDGVVKLGFPADPLWPVFGKVAVDWRVNDPVVGSWSAVLPDQLPPPLRQVRGKDADVPPVAEDGGRCRTEGEAVALFRRRREKFLAAVAEMERWGYTVEWEGKLAARKEV